MQPQQQQGGFGGFGASTGTTGGLFGGATQSTAAKPAFPSFSLSGTTTAPAGGGLFGGGSAFASGGGLFGSAPAAQAPPTLSQPSDLRHPSLNWADLATNPLMLELEKQVRDHRQGLKELEDRLRAEPRAPTQLKREMEAALGRMRQDLASIGARAGAADRTVAGVQAQVHQLLRDTQDAARLLNRSAAWRSEAKRTGAVGLSMTVLDPLPVVPSPILVEVVQHMERVAQQLAHHAAELEGSVRPATAGPRPGEPLSWSAVPALVRQMNDLLFRTAAKVEALDRSVGRAKAAALQRRWQMGNDVDPFEEAERKEAALARARGSQVSNILVRTRAQQQQSQQSAQQSAQQPQPAVAAPATAAPSSGSLFGGSFGGFGASTAPGAQQAKPAFGFGGLAPATASAGAAPGATTAAPTTGGGLFGAATAATAAPTTPGLSFGAPAAAPAAQPGPSAPSTSLTFGFGGSTSTGTPTAAAAPSGTTSPLFGGAGALTPNTPTGSVGAPAANIFGSGNAKRRTTLAPLNVGGPGGSLAAPSTIS